MNLVASHSRTSGLRLILPTEWRKSVIVWSASTRDWSIAIVNVRFSIIRTSSSSGTAGTSLSWTSFAACRFPSGVWSCSFAPRSALSTAWIVSGYFVTYWSLTTSRLCVLNRFVARRNTYAPGTFWVAVQSQGSQQISPSISPEMSAGICSGALMWTRPIFLTSSRSSWAYSSISMVAVVPLVRPSLAPSSCFGVLISFLTTIPWSEEKSESGAMHFAGPRWAMSPMPGTSPVATTWRLPLASASFISAPELKYVMLTSSPCSANSLPAIASGNCADWPAALACPRTTRVSSGLRVCARAVAGAVPSPAPAIRDPPRSWTARLRVMRSWTDVSAITVLLRRASVRFLPVLGDVLHAGEPHVRELPHVLDQPLQHQDPPRLPDQLGVQHQDVTEAEMVVAVELRHPGLVRALRAQDMHLAGRERVLEEEEGRVVELPVGGDLDEIARLAVDNDPEGAIVAAPAGIVEEAEVADVPHRVRSVIPVRPDPDGRAAGDALDQLDAPRDDLLLLGMVHGAKGLVEVSVVRDLMPPGEDLLRHLRVAFDRVAGDEEGRLDGIPVEQIQDAHHTPQGPIGPEGQELRLLRRLRVPHEPQ